ncbi:hypothetical protein VPH35_051744 [Triticum aestivum]
MAVEYEDDRIPLPDGWWRCAPAGSSDELADDGRGDPAVSVLTSSSRGHLPYSALSLTASPQLCRWPPVAVLGCRASAARRGYMVQCRSTIRPEHLSISPPHSPTSSSRTSDSPMNTISPSCSSIHHIPRRQSIRGRPEEECQGLIFPL